MKSMLLKAHFTKEETITPERVVTDELDSAYEEAKVIVENPVYTFVPTGKQEDFMCLSSMVQVFSGANWAGKTTISMIKLASLIWDSPNKFLDYEYIHKFPGRFRFRIVSPNDLIESDVLASLKMWFPKNRYTTTKANRTFESRITCDTGTTGDVMTYDQDPEQFEGVKLDVVLFNEVPPRRIFSATIARMKPHGIIMIAMTPLTGSAWIYDRIDNSDWGIIYADIESVCNEHGKRGYMPHESIAKKIKEYDPEELEARVHGRPLHLMGRVYKSFQRNTHIIPRFEVPKDWTRYLICDPHDRKPFALSWLAVSPVGKAVVYDESPSEQFHDQKSCSLTVKDYANIIRAKEKDTGGVAQTRIIDARFGAKQSSQTSRTIMELFQDEGLIFIPSYTDNRASIDSGHQQVKEWLSNGPDGVPRLQVMDHCHNHIWSFEHYVWDDFRTDDKGLKEKPKESGKDFADCIRYFCMDDPIFHQAPTDIVQLPTWVQENNAGLENVGYGA
ncbi:large terminase protein [Caudoviricetes sp.]|nr:large terminase protein [Caudoviricetes sp.]UOF80991.1 large terminase protein [Caudoviricetes sp.]UOF81373.1 large terminase protein [Caudoviricetes sp.]